MISMLDRKQIFAVILLSILAVNMIITVAALAFSTGAVIVGGAFAAGILAESATNDHLSENTKITVDSGLNQEQQKTDLYNDVLSTSNFYKNQVNTSDNLQSLQEGIMRLESKESIVEDRADSVGETDALINAKSAVDRVSSNTQKNVITIWETIHNDLCKIEKTEDNADLDGRDTVLFTAPDDDLASDTTLDGNIDFDPAGNATGDVKDDNTYDCAGHTESLNLTTSKDVNISAITVYSSYGVQENISLKDIVNADDSNMKNFGITAIDPSSGDEKEMLRFGDLRKMWQDNLQAHNVTTDQLGNVSSGLVDDIYSNYEAGDFENLSNLYTPYDKFRDSMSSDSIGSKSYRNLLAASAGLDGAFDKSVTLETNGENLSGEFISDATPPTDVDNDSKKEWEVGKEYDPANFSEPIYTQTEDSMEKITDPFTITNATNPQTGESYENFSPRQNEFTSTNTSDLKTQLKEMEEITESIEANQAGGGGSLPGGNLVLVLAILGVLLYVMSRNGGGGSGSKGGSTVVFGGSSGGSSSKKKSKKKK